MDNINRFIDKITTFKLFISKGYSHGVLMHDYFDPNDFKEVEYKEYAFYSLKNSFYDRPEKINKLVNNALTDLLLLTEDQATKQLDRITILLSIMVPFTKLSLTFGEQYANEEAFQSLEQQLRSNGFSLEIDENKYDLDLELLVTDYFIIALHDDIITRLDSLKSLKEEYRKVTRGFGNPDSNNIEDGPQNERSRILSDLDRYQFSNVLSKANINSNDALNLLLNNETKYKIAFLDHVGFLNHLFKNHSSNIKEKMYAILSRIFNLPLDSIKKCYLGLSKKSYRKDYHSYSCLEQIKSDIENLR